VNGVGFVVVFPIKQTTTDIYHSRTQATEAVLGKEQNVKCMNPERTGSITMSELTSVEGEPTQEGQISFCNAEG
jgi:hypothetical protein